MFVLVFTAGKPPLSGFVDASEYFEFEDHLGEGDFGFLGDDSDEMSEGDAEEVEADFYLGVKVRGAETTVGCLSFGPIEKVLRFL